MGEHLVEMRGIKKSFGSVQALKGVDFHVGYGEIVGLLGDNGAGKSTLIKVLVGYHQPDEGEILFEGKRVRFSSPKEAREAGIEIVYQDLALINLMSVWRNFFLGRELVKRVGPLTLLDTEKMKRVAIRELQDIGVSVTDPDKSVSFLSGGERQAIAIGRSMYFGAKLLILDEPTAALSIKETRKVLELIQHAKERGLSVIFITHNVYHVYSVADRFTILSHGKKIADLKKEETDAEEIMEIIARGE